MSFNLPVKTLFIAQYNGQQTNVTGDGTAATFPFSLTPLNVGTCFASNTFTAPKTGYYMFNGVVTMSIGAGTGMTSGSLSLVVNSSTIYLTFSNPLAIKDVNNNLQMIVPTSFLSLTAGNTVTLSGSISGGSKTAAFGNTNTLTNFWTGLILN